MLSVLDAHKATLAQPSSRLPQQVAEHFAEDATLLYVPTAAGAQGRRAIEQFIKQAGAQSHMIEEEKSVVEEVVVTLTHSDSIEWLLPGVRATKKRVVVPMRVYWDQASVLRQLAVLPRSLYCKANASEVQLPVLDAAIAAPLHGVRFEPNGTGRRTYGDTNRSQFSFGDDSTPVSPTLSQASSAAAKQLRQQPSSEAFDEQPLPRPLHTGRRMNPNSNHSQFSFGGADAADGAGDQAGGVRPLRPSPFDAPLSAVSSTSSMSFDEQPLPAARSGRRDPNALSEAPAHRPSSRVLRAPGGGSSISFG
ncbi:hypothetical protein HK105_208964 [Polyrhizophydium stewartii]|uniref:BRCT domain-containing protein n=1 Tax=Polyrhizophydium stewartii TaxID=2732419 RepID=A0ABR4MWB6_9FUNG